MGVAACGRSSNGLGNFRGDVVARAQRPPAENAFVREHWPPIPRQFGVAFLELFALRRELVPMLDGLGVALPRRAPAARHLLPRRPRRRPIADLHSGWSPTCGGTAPGAWGVIGRHAGDPRLETVPGFAGEIVENHQL